MRIEVIQRQAEPIRAEAGLKESIVTVFLASLALLPVDVAVLQTAKRLNISPQQVEEVVSVLPAARLPEGAEPQSPSTADAKPADAKDLITVAKTIYWESGGEGFDGKLAVGSAIWNRAKGNPSVFAKEVLRPHQFTSWSEKKKAPDTGSKAWQDSLSIAKRMFSGGFTPVTDKTHFYAFKGGNAMSKPPWWAAKAVNMRLYDDFGNHRFLTPVT